MKTFKPNIAQQHMAQKEKMNSLRLEMLKILRNDQMPLALAPMYEF